ncbi:MAG: helix-turn-helix domain-containing protein [Lachnospiraceae bacterium]|nr:helix-turn-helix domain-containing protein [Lachnospiraceae bacterium]MBR1914156.1 helix-turn-helix domain-containing protein [Lachnospiraceae bacterium]
MITNQVIQKAIDELKEITKVDLAVMEPNGTQAAATFAADEVISPVSIRSFIDSGSDSEVSGEYRYLRVMDEGVTSYVLISKGIGDKENIVGKIALSEMTALSVAYKERFDKNSFFQSLIMDNLLVVDIYNRAKKLHIPIDSRRCVFLVETDGTADMGGIEVLRSVFPAASDDYVTETDERTLVVIKSFEAGEDEDEQIRETAEMLVDTMNTQAMVNVRVSYGKPVSEIKQVSASYKEAKMAMEVGRIFYQEKAIVSYDTLGIGRLIYQLQPSLCETFLGEIFGEDIPEHLDEETLNTINKFFENNLNVSETSRQLFVHRNTLVYRIEKLQKATGLDIRTFDDALTLKIALMVVNYMKYIRKHEF